MRIIPAHRKYRRKRPVRAHGTAIYCREKDILSRPIIGHTPRKLPALAAISRIIAVCAGAIPWQLLHKLTYCTVRGEKCQEKFSLFFIIAGLILNAKEHEAPRTGRFGSIAFIFLYHKQAAKDGWGTVYRDENNALVCDEDCSASLYTKNGGYFGISPYEEINTKEMPKQAECAAIITSDSCGFTFCAEDFSQIHIFVTRDENGLIDTYRVEYGESHIYDEDQDYLQLSG